MGIAWYNTNYKPTNYIYIFTLYRIVQAKAQGVPPPVHVQRSTVRVMRCSICIHEHTPFHMHIDIATIIQNAWVVCASTCQSCKSYAVVCAHVYELACVAVAWLVTWYTLNDSKTRVYDKRAWACACARGYFNCFLALITTCVIPPREIMLRLAWTTTALHDTRVKAPPDHELTYTAPAVADSKLHTSHTRPPRKLGS